MEIFIKRIFFFLLAALLIAFVIIPGYEVSVGGQSLQENLERIISNLKFEANEIWKRVFIFYLALWCGKAILWALSTARIKTE